MFKVITLLLPFVFCNRPGKIIKVYAGVANPVITFHPCNGTNDIYIQYEPGKPKKENEYLVHINEKFMMNTKCELTFDSPATVILNKPKRALVIKVKENFTVIHFLTQDNHLSFKVQGPSLQKMPYLTSIKIYNFEICEEPNTGFLDKFLLRHQDIAKTALPSPDSVSASKTCGRRKVLHTGLFVNGHSTKPGEWPWHGAVYTNNTNVKYICGCTLISKIFVLTAANCVTVRGTVILPKTIKVVFGKYNLYGAGSLAQEREVHQIFVHEEFNIKHLDNDIALLKLSLEVTLTEYVQPVCLWNPEDEDEMKLAKANIHGMVIGWGINKNYTLSTEIRKTDLPKLNETECLKINPLFYSMVLNDKKFCAGFGNGTSACNGDSGGGFHVFVPDQPENKSPNAPGTWHVRGIMTMIRAKPNCSFCDPTQPVIFTDVAKFWSWINKHLYLFIFKKN